MQPNSVAPTQFLNGTNYHKIIGFLRQKYTQKLGVNSLPERMDSRLQKTVQHYMTEISKSGTNAPIQSLNQEVLRETVSSVDTWLKKQEASSQPAVATIGSFSRPDEYSKLFEDTNTRYNNVVESRAPKTSQVKDISDAEEDPVVLMQRIQKQREDQMRSMGISNTPPRLEITEPTPSSVNPVAPQADAPPPLLAPRQQEYIIPQEDIVKYRDTEYNIFLTSSDRDWFRNTAETRYNFSVNFNTGTKRIGFPYTAALQERFRNIQRIEFVKAIIPIESFGTLQRVATNTGGNVTYDLTRVINVFSLPFVGIRIAELNNNGFSTKPEEDNTFAIVQYDTTWSSDLTCPSTNANMHGQPVSTPLTKSGYTTLIPKYLKTQKVYTPTPLATLQKLSIRIERHNGDLLSDASDVWKIQRVCLSGFNTSQTTKSLATTNNSIYNVLSPPNSYIFVKTSKYFPFSAISEGDTIVFQGYANSNTTSDTSVDFITFMNKLDGHVVVATAYVNGTTLMDGRNNQGYCNIIILKSRFNDPSTGSVVRDTSYFGGSESNEQAYALMLDDYDEEYDQQNSAIINQNRQSHMVLRVITRDMDSSTNIRPDNV